MGGDIPEGGRYAKRFLTIASLSQIWPQVKIARLAAIELGRVQAFAEHIRYCANKFGLGVNFMPNTPNYDRVVEMQALNESLIRAFPDMQPDGYPWPDHERRGERGTGWVAAPEAKSLVMPDPGAEIMRIALGKPRQRNTASPQRGPSPPLPTSASPLPPARRASPSMTASDAGGLSSSSAAQGENSLQPSRPASASPMSAGGRQNVVDRPVSASRTRFSNLAATYEAGPVDSSNRYAKLHKSLSSQRLFSANAPQSPPQGMGDGGRPQSAAQMGSSRVSRPASASPAAHQRPASGGGSRYLPARLSAKLGGMKGALAVMRGGSAGNSPVQPVFMRDLPRLRYTEIDVQAME